MEEYSEPIHGASEWFCPVCGLRNNYSNDNEYICSGGKYICGYRYDSRGEQWRTRQRLIKMWDKIGCPVLGVKW